MSKKRRERSRFAIAFALLIVWTMVMELWQVEMGQVRAEGQKDLVVDKDTSQDWKWKEGEEISTKNIGRIWTDKSVFPSKEADFMVGLSALSSASNTSATINTPLDIVLVLDVSGSMNEKMNGETKLSALKTAVHDFIDATAAQNENMTDETKHHHISLVKYAYEGYCKNNPDSVGDERNKWGYNYSQIVTGLTDDRELLKKSVEALQAGGGTAADYGMSLAKRVLHLENGHGAREHAQKVVILFTDGEPTYGNRFDTRVATDAISYAKELKDEGALVYSVGVEEEADPEEEMNVTVGDNINAYLHSISGNYPHAAGWKNGSWILGERGEKADFYKAARNSGELQCIFQDISEDIHRDSGYPTDAAKGREERDGYVTFCDQLGDDMELRSFDVLVLSGHTFTVSKEMRTEDKIRYIYEGTVEIRGEKRNVSHLLVTVTLGEGRRGDMVEVSIPAALLPLRDFQVALTEDRMEIAEQAPLQIFYHVGVKEQAKRESGTFYSNLFTGQKGDVEGITYGDTQVRFEPAKSNRFYYFTEDTPIWEEESCVTPVTKYEADKTYYYMQTYYERGADKRVEEKREIRSFHALSEDEKAGNVSKDEQGQIYVKAGTTRLMRGMDLTERKEDVSLTDTATEVFATSWKQEGETKWVETALGNNGRLSIVLPEKPDVPEKPIEPDEPVAPEKPTKPQEPSEPKEPFKPEKPDKPEVPDTVKTGDFAPLWSLLVMMGVSAAVIAVGVRKRRRGA